MDKLKGISKGGWHPPGDRQISRDTWKSDLKGMATGKKKDPYEEGRNHQSKPLSTLRDPASFAPPPKHSGYYGSASSVASPASPAAVQGRPAPPPEPSGGWGSAAPAPSRRQQEPVEEEPPKPPEPYRMDTSGLRTDNLPKPPLRRGEGGASSPARTASPSVPPRQTPPLPSRQPAAAAKPPPVLPPRMTENPNEYTPPPPPTYGEATKPGPEAGIINQAAASRLGQAGVSVPGFGIGGSSGGDQQQPTTPAGHAGQLSELQQRFSRLGAGTQSQSPAPRALNSPVAAAAAKKPPPPPPPAKKSTLGGVGAAPQSNGAPAPPPLPLSSKPKPSG
ncbi:hypothetical protein B0A50_06633 [Salinomyces thailandicus]|uniref:Uncharacterized protein n=1 Tax=Salinomyces thailandicus TaxID=706561 RepID=A0A4U0TRE7_9PEZI|nr:hypothetical protein B0A50_06633 [Salinomyces thailandica]